MLWSVSIDLPASSLVVSAPPVPVFPFRRAPSARRFRPRPCQFSRFRRAPSARRFRPFRAVFPFRRAPSARRFRPPVPFSRFVARFSPDAPVCPSGFPLRRALLVQRLFPSVPSPVLPLFALPAHRSFFLSPGTIVLDEHLCSLAVC